ncbi:Glycosyltransferase involved in cell wall bisynthesis [Bryocella elongata]|uniref:Glycosyltransferase involved in cell wall bisynthesis n=1 Tax=Bryocella elongata TaxID=863522 RepID=A0A1H5W0J8_9BACT|nr:glycosyltransferase [Bryocella elongata]SEF93039.1 Glycosyltransferase involved in cell wall bisynthesis [Bryocella elongata]
MRFLHLIGTMDPAAGGPTESVRLLLSDGYSGEVVSLDAPDAAYLRSYPFPVHALGPVSHRYGFSLKLNRWLRENVHRFDCVIVNGLWGYPGLAALDEVRGKLPYFVFAHGMLDPYFKHRFPLKHLKKWIYWLLVEYRVLVGADYVLFTSEAEARLARESFWLHRWRELIVPYGTGSPPDRTPAMREAFLDRCPEVRDRRFLLFFGRLHPKKGCDLLIEAFAKTAALDRELDLVMAGPDEVGWASQLQELASRLGVADRIHWPGLLRDDAKYGALYMANAFVLPSHQENFGIAVAEALACGVPALLSDKVNIAAEVQADGAGLMQPDTLEGTEALLRGWLELSPNQRNAMRIQALRTAEVRYRMDRTAAMLVEKVRKAQRGHAAGRPRFSQI